MGDISDLKISRDSGTKAPDLEKFYQNAGVDGVSDAVIFACDPFFLGCPGPSLCWHSGSQTLSVSVLGQEGHQANGGEEKSCF